jgi:hypothetical protein
MFPSHWQNTSTYPGNNGADANAGVGYPTSQTQYSTFSQNEWGYVQVDNDTQDNTIENDDSEYESSYNSQYHNTEGNTAQNDNGDESSSSDESDQEEQDRNFGESPVQMFYAW